MTEFSEMNCPVARTLDIIGDRWTPLVVRDLFYGLSRFDTIQRNLGVSRKVLTERLAKLTEHGIVEREPYQDNPPRHDYRLTEKGSELAVVLLALKLWGDRWTYAGEAPPMEFVHATCGSVTHPVLTCSDCGEPLGPDQMQPVLSPDYEPGPGTLELPAAMARLAAADA